MRIAERRVRRTPEEVCRRELVRRKMFSGMKIGSVEIKAVRPAMKRIVKA